MAPKITDGTEIRFSVDNKHTLLVRSLVPKTNADFVVSTAGGQNQDQGALSGNTSGGIAESKFYAATNRIADVGPGTNVYVRSSEGKPVVVIQLERTKS